MPGAALAFEPSRCALVTSDTDVTPVGEQVYQQRFQGEIEGDVQVQ
jgi:hypothetical protein